MNLEGFTPKYTLIALQPQEPNSCLLNISQHKLESVTSFRPSAHLTQVWKDGAGRKPSSAYKMCSWFKNTKIKVELLSSILTFFNIKLNKLFISQILWLTTRWIRSKKKIKSNVRKLCSLSTLPCCLGNSTGQNSTQQSSCFSADSPQNTPTPGGYTNTLSKLPHLTSGC